MFRHKKGRHRQVPDIKEHFKNIKKNIKNISKTSRFIKLSWLKEGIF